MSYTRNNGFEDVESLRNELALKRAKLRGATEARDMDRLSGEISRLQIHLDNALAETNGMSCSYTFNHTAAHLAV
jgi:hypothetical protein